MDNLHTTRTKVSQSQRESLLNQKAKLIWFTGLSGSGKSTLAVNLESRLHAQGLKTYLLDGDNMRMGLNKDLGFDEAGRVENIRRIGEVSRLFIDAGVIVISAFISPYESDREKVRTTVGADNYIEVFVDCPIEECERRDVKGLYQKARAGKIPNFTGIDSPYEKPAHPDLILKTKEMSLDHSLDLLLNLVLSRVKRS